MFSSAAAKLRVHLTPRVSNPNYFGVIHRVAGGVILDTTSGMYIIVPQQTTLPRAFDRHINK
jgi:hypothetical protein